MTTNQYVKRLLAFLSTRSDYQVIFSPNSIEFCIPETGVCHFHVDVAELHWFGMCLAEGDFHPWEVEMFEAFRTDYSEYLISTIY